MSRSFAPLLVAALLLTGLANAATLTITADQSTYVIGQTITLSIAGDSQGAANDSAFGDLRFASALATAISASQVALTSNGGADVWVTGVLPVGAGYAITFNQINGIFPPTLTTLDAPLSATVVLQAAAAGTLSFNWATTPASQALDFFGLSNTPGTSVQILVPEPTTALLFAGGLAALAVIRRPARRRR